MEAQGSHGTLMIPQNVNPMVRTGQSCGDGNESLVDSLIKVEDDAAQSSVQIFQDETLMSNLQKFFQKARTSDKYLDVVLHVQSKKFHAHKLVLAAASPYFDSIFMTRDVSRGGSRNVEHIVISSTKDADIFGAFLNYIYCGEITVHKGNVGEIMRLANHFLLYKLKEFCGTFLMDYIDVENCIQIKDLADKYSLPELSGVASSFIQANLQELVNHEVTMELTPRQIENFVREKSWSLPQEAAVKFISRWVFHDTQHRERDCKQLLSGIDWTSMQPQSIIDYIDQDPLYGTSERCFYYVLHSLALKGLRIPKYESMYQALQQKYGQETSSSCMGYGDNLLQMAFNSAMEGLTDSSAILLQQGNEMKLGVELGDGKSRARRKTFSLEQRRKRVLRKLKMKRAMRKWVVVRMDRPKLKQLRDNEIVAESSGEEECDPAEKVNGFYKCHICPYVVKKISRLERHLSTIHGHDVTYKCSECSFTCKWNREYFLHMRSHFEGPPYKCPNCEYLCKKIGSLMAHRLTHLNANPFHCPDCDFKCRNKANLAVHVKTHFNEKPFKCTVCGRHFISKNSLDQHAVGHNTDKTYSCTICPFSTKYLSHYTNHKKSHPNLSQSVKKGKVYKCEDGECSYVTSKKSQLESHMRSHAGVRPHVCSICGRRFLEKSHLVRHERIHFNERPFKCSECDYASTRRDKLKEHRNRHHGENASAKSPYKPRPHKKSKSGSENSVDNTQTEMVSNNANDSKSQLSTVVYAKKSQPTTLPTTIKETTSNINNSIIRGSNPSGGTTVAIKGSNVSAPTNTSLTNISNANVSNIVSVAARQQNAVQTTAPQQHTAMEFILPDIPHSASHVSFGGAQIQQQRQPQQQSHHQQQQQQQHQTHHVQVAQSQVNVPSGQPQNADNVVQIHHHTSSQHIRQPNTSTVATIDLQTLANSGIVQLTRGFPQNASVQVGNAGSTAVGSANSSGKISLGGNLLTITNAGNPTVQTERKPRFLVLHHVPGKGTLHRSVDLKMEDLQSQGLLQAFVDPQNPTVRNDQIKIVDLNAATLQTVPGGSGAAVITGSDGSGTQMVLDAAQLQQIAAAVSGSGGNLLGASSGTPVIVSAPQSQANLVAQSTANAQSNVTVHHSQVPASSAAQHSQQHSQNQTGGASSNDFSGLNNILY